MAKHKIIDRTGVALGGQANHRTLDQITHVAWHYTATLLSFITNHERYWRDTLEWLRGGYHFYIDRQGRIYQNYNYRTRSNGVGNNNTYIVNICCEASSPNNYTSAQIEAREWLTRIVMADLNIPARNVLGHKEFPGQSTACPGYSAAVLARYRNQLAQTKPTIPSVPKGKELQKYVGNNGWHRIKAGETVTIRQGAKRWVNASFKQMEPMKKDYAGRTDIVSQVKAVKIGYSNEAYFLKNMKVWVLQQDLVEPRLTPIMSAPKGKELQPYIGNAGWHKLNQGEKVTIRKGHQRWLNSNFIQMEPKAKGQNYTGRTDTIGQVARVRTSYSDYAYFLKGMKIWVLQQDLVESRLTFNRPNTPKGKEFQTYQGGNNWKKLKAGDKATIRKGHQRWLNDSFKQMEPKAKDEDYAGRMDTISKVAPVRTGYSDVAYYLKNMKVWVLEQDLVEPRA